MSKIKDITFTNYKAFVDKQELELRPITLLVGKNSSGKSSILKLFSALQTATYDENAQLKLFNGYVSLGSRYEDLFNNHSLTDLKLGVDYENDLSLNAEYVINNGILYRYKLSTSHSGKTIETPLNKDSKGNLVNGLISKDSFDKLGLEVSEAKFEISYIGPFRKSPERNIDFGGISSFNSTGCDGRYSYPILLDSYLQKGELFNNVSQWMKNNLENQEISIEQISPTSGTYSFFINRNDSKVNIADVGQGIGQLLPIIVESYLDNHKDVVAIEQPALHIHPADHASIIYRLAKSAKEYKKKYLVETHSANILLGLRNLISDKNNDFKSEDAVIYFVDMDEDEGVASLDKIEILPDGTLTQWPEGVFGESFDLMSQIINNQKA